MTWKILTAALAVLLVALLLAAGVGSLQLSPLIVAGAAVVLLVAAGVLVYLRRHRPDLLRSHKKLP